MKRRLSGDNSSSDFKRSKKEFSADEVDFLDSSSDDESEGPVVKTTPRRNPTPSLNRAQKRKSLQITENENTDSEDPSEGKTFRRRPSLIEKQLEPDAEDIKALAEEEAEKPLEFDIQIDETDEPSPDEQNDASEPPQKEEAQKVFEVQANPEILKRLKNIVKEADKTQLAEFCSEMFKNHSENSKILTQEELKSCLEDEHWDNFFSKKIMNEWLDDLTASSPLTEEIFVKFMTEKYTAIMTKKRVSDIFGGTYELQRSASFPKVHITNDSHKTTPTQDSKLAKSAPHMKMKSSQKHTPEAQQLSKRPMLESPDLGVEPITELPDPPQESKTGKKIQVLNTGTRAKSDKPFIVPIPRKKKQSSRTNVLKKLSSQTHVSPLVRGKKPTQDTPRPVTDPIMNSPSLNTTWNEMHIKGAASVSNNVSQPKQLSTPTEKTLNTPTEKKKSRQEVIKLIVTPQESPQKLDLDHTTKNTVPQTEEITDLDDDLPNKIPVFAEIEEEEKRRQSEATIENKGNKDEEKNSEGKSPQKEAGADPMEIEKGESPTHDIELEGTAKQDNETICTRSEHGSPLASSVKKKPPQVLSDSEIQTPKSSKFEQEQQDAQAREAMSGISFKETEDKMEVEGVPSVSEPKKEVEKSRVEEKTVAVKKDSAITEESAPAKKKEEDPEKEAERKAKRKKLWSRIKDIIRLFSNLYEEYEDEEITHDTFWQKGSKLIRKLAMIELAVKKNGKNLEPENHDKFYRKINRIRKCFEDEFEDTEEMKSCLMKMNKKDPDDVWQYNYITQEACLQSENEKLFRIPLDIYFKLHPYQRIGLSWQFELFCDQIGGILADDMGLGKTVMTCAFLRGIMGSCKVRSVLLVVPVSTLSSWEHHLKEWAGKRFRMFRGNEKVKTTAFEKIIQKGGVLVTSYETLRNSINILINTKFDYCILDEAHKCKNPHSKQSQAIRKLRIRKCHRLMLTGTYLQNKMEELWALIDWCTQGKILGPYRDFRNSFARSIDNANVRDASRVEKEIAEQLRQELREIIEPYVLRRTKNEVGLGVGVQKNEMVLWVEPTEVQKDLYNSFLQSEPVQTILNSSKSPLAALVAMKKICDHPFILPQSQIELCPDLEDLKEMMKEQTYENIIKASGKLSVLEKLLLNLKENNHKVLVFSGYVKTMTLIKKILDKMEVEYRYIDGKVDHAVRQDYIDEFNEEDSNIFAFCSTTGVGGLGLTITGANRVIMYDPDWNPANDAQAVDRAYRLGQKRNVVVYRLCTCETLEDKIYRRQVSKRGLLEMIDTGGHVKKFFTRDELRRVFTPLEDCTQSSTQKLMIGHHPKPYKSYPDLEDHIKDVLSIDGVAGISHHDEIFKIPAGAKMDDEETDEENRMEEDAKIKATLEAKLKRRREEQERERLLTQQDGGSPILTTRKRRKLAAQKNGWNHETFNQFAGTPPESKKKRKLKEKPGTPDDGEEKPFDPTPTSPPDSSPSKKRKLSESEIIGSEQKKRKLGSKNSSLAEPQNDLEAADKPAE